MATSAPPASLSQSKPSPPIPRAGTFRAPRPVSTGPSGLRRGASFLNRPDTFTSTDASSSVLEPEHVDAIPRLRRGPSFIARPRVQLSDDPSVPVLRRGGSRPTSVVPGPQTPLDEGLKPVSKRLSRAGTYSQSGAKGRSAIEALDVSSASGKTATQCLGSDDFSPGDGHYGAHGMPPWAPERLKTMTDEEKAVVMSELEGKEEKGRLEAELRKKRVKDTYLQVERAESQVVMVDTDGELEQHKSEGILAAGITSEEFDELESVDLATEASGRSSSKSSRRRSRSGSNGDTEEFGEDISAAVASGRGRKSHVQEADCTECGDLEGKVKDLEEQLAVLKKVVARCADADDKEKLEEEKKPKTWKDKVMSAYFGNSSTSNEKNRLKQEVEALRKATDFLFRKLQQNE